MTDIEKRLNKTIDALNRVSKMPPPTKKPAPTPPPGHGAGCGCEDSPLDIDEGAYSFLDHADPGFVPELCPTHQRDVQKFMAHYARLHPNVQRHIAYNAVNHVLNSQSGEL